MDGMKEHITSPACQLSFLEPITSAAESKTEPLVESVNTLNCKLQFDNNSCSLTSEVIIAEFTDRSEPVILLFSQYQSPLGYGKKIRRSTTKQ